MVDKGIYDVAKRSGRGVGRYLSVLKAILNKKLLVALVTFVLV